MKKLMIFAVSTLSFNAQAYDNYQDTGRVIEVEPIYQQVRINDPETRCWNERVTHTSSGHGNAASTVIGGIVGGLIGNRFGGGRGKDAATVAGSLLGAAVASDHSRPSRESYTSTERRCETVNHTIYQKERVGYRVHYEYNGHDYWTTTTRHPGKRIAVSVAINAHEYNYSNDDTQYDRYDNSDHQNNSSHFVGYDDDDYDL